MSFDLSSEENAIGPWPRRLLHVPTMTSHPWTPGNIYNGIAEPAYNAITYTWGRWRLAEFSRPDVESLDISIEGDGDSWPIPRVAPEHFSVDQFEDAIVSATFCPGTGGEDVDFIWLDIACISQRAHDARSAAEIGRQADIFRGARCVFVWFTTVSAGELKEVVDHVWWVEGEQPEEYTERHEAANAGLVRLLSDPWFSSLWTLQEAFLRQDAYLISSDPSLVERSGAGALCDLSAILYPCSRWRSCFDRIVNLTQLQAAEIDEVEHMIQQRGLLALSSQHEIATYIAAQSRTASRPNDRIYGLQQVFRLRLGNTAVEPTRSTFDIAELENQFGQALLLNHPVHSQMHVFAAHVPARERWQIRSCSRELRDDAFRLPGLFDERLIQIEGPPPAFLVRSPTTTTSSPSPIEEEISAETHIWTSRQNALTIHSSFSISPLSLAITWTGLTLPFTSLHHLSHKIYTHVHLPQRHEAIQQDILDASDPPPIFPLFVDLDACDDIPSAPHTSRRFADFLGQKFAQHEVHVLLLASCWPAYTQEGFKHGMFGLLLVEQETQWARIGVCQWSCEADWEAERLELSREEMGLLSGQGVEWVRNDGVLGFAR